VQTLDISAVLESLSDALPILRAHLFNKFLQFLVLCLCPVALLRPTDARARTLTLVEFTRARLHLKL